MISHEHHAIFIHIPKSAGTSVGTKLGLYSEAASWGMQDHRGIRHLTPLCKLNIRNYFNSSNYEIIYRYLRDKYLLKREYPSAEELKSYYKFTFVRNSWSRVFSWYRNVMNDEMHMHRYKIPEGASFAWFVDNRLNTLKDQLHYITDADGNVVVDFVGHYENLSIDFAQVCVRLGIPDPELPRKNSEGAPPYVSHYSDDLIEKVGLHYAADIRYFKFEFGKN